MPILCDLSIVHCLLFVNWPIIFFSRKIWKWQCFHRVFPHPQILGGGALFWIRVHINFGPSIFMCTIQYQFFSFFCSLFSPLNAGTSSTACFPPCLGTHWPQPTIVPLVPHLQGRLANATLWEKLKQPEDHIQEQLTSKLLFQPFWKQFVYKESNLGSRVLPPHHFSWNASVLVVLGE